MHNKIKYLFYFYIVKAPKLSARNTLVIYNVRQKADNFNRRRLCVHYQADTGMTHSLFYIIAICLFHSQVPSPVLLMPCVVLLGGDVFYITTPIYTQLTPQRSSIYVFSRVASDFSCV